MEVAGVPAFLASQGYTAGTRIISTRVAPPDTATRNALKLGRNDFVFDIRRVRHADSSPISLEHAQFPAGRVPGLLEQQLGRSLYEILESQYGVIVARVEERIEAVNATAAEAASLKIKPRSALLLITRTAYDADSRPIEFSRDLFRADALYLVVTAQGRRASATNAVCQGHLPLAGEGPTNESSHRHDIWSIFDVAGLTGPRGLAAEVDDVGEERDLDGDADPDPHRGGQR
jgi:GntR family transcriptional regulator